MNKAYACSRAGETLGNKSRYHLLVRFQSIVRQKESSVLHHNAYKGTFGEDL